MNDRAYRVLTDAAATVAIVSLIYYLSRVI